MPFQIPPIVLIIGFGAAFSFGAFAFSLIPVKSDLARRLERVENLNFDSVKTRNEGFARIFNDQQRGAIRRKLDAAGWYETTPGRVAIQIIACGLFGASAGVAFVVEMDYGPKAYVFSALLAFVAGYVPLSRLERAVKRRKSAILRALPDFLDMLATTVSAGLAFNAALTYAQDVAEGPLSEEIAAALSEVRLGRSRADALRAMAARVGQEQFSTFVTAVVQAERLGSNLGNVLKELAEDVRNQRMNRAEEIASMMPTKMALPMALFMLPALFIMIFGGVVAQLMTTGASPP